MPRRPTRIKWPVTEITAARKGQQRAVERGAIVPAEFDFEATIPFYVKARKLTRETGIQHEVDHIVPCRIGGLHDAGNLQVLTQAENLSKHKADEEALHSL